MGTVKLTPEQLRAVESTGGRLLVSAAAGSGKTKVLVERLLRRLEAGAGLEDFLIITYTNAAAAELRAKILDAIFERIAEDPGNLKLRREAAAAGRARIGTIHSFCSAVIRANAHKLRLPPDFRVAEEQETQLLQKDALTGLLDDLYDSGDRDFYALADTLGAGRDDSALERVIFDTYTKLMSHPDPESWAEAQIKAMELDGVTDLAQTPWGQVIMGRALEAARYWAEQMEYLVDEAEGDEKLKKGYGRSFAATLASLRAFERALQGSWDGARAAANIDFPTGRISGYEAQKAVRNECKEAMKKISALLWDDSEKALGDMKRVAPALRALWRTVLEFDRRFSELKRKRGVLDYSDMEHLALKLLIDRKTGEPTGVARELSEGILEIMVDEYQDVNEIQEAIFNAVSRNGENIFTVGDVKQSIYRFRLADPSIFLGHYLSSRDEGEAGEGEPRRVVLSANFRSHEGILKAVNFVFRNVMSVRLGELDYTGRECLRLGAPRACTAEPPVELDVIDLKRPEGGEGTPVPESADDIDDKTEAEALFAARRVRELVLHGTLPDVDGERPVRYGDIAVLMRSPRAMIPVWQRVFAKMGIPLKADVSSDFFAEHEVSLTLSLLAIIDNPRQDIPLICVLRSPIYGFTGDELGEIRTYDSRGDFWQALNAAAGEMEKCAGFLKKLSELRDAAPDMTADELLWYVYSKTRLFALVSAMPDGERRREHLMELLELAKSCEGAGYRGLFGFLTWIRAMRESGKSPERTASSGENAVTIMSVHKSKGLEFPIVILAGLTRRFNTEDTRSRLLIHPKLGAGPKLTDTARGIEYYTAARRAISIRLREELLSEEMRVLYVAMTRPREKLIILTSHADAEKELSKLMNIPLPAPAELLSSRQCMADWILIPALARPESGAIRFGAPFMPCDTEGERWDVRLIKSLDMQGSDEEPLEDASTPAPPPEVPAEMRARLEYVYPHMGAVDMPSKVTATELKGTFRTREAAEEAVSVQGEAPAEPPFMKSVPRRPGFMDGVKELTPAQKGTATHMVMQFADYKNVLTPSGAAAEIERLRSKGVISDRQAAAVRPEVISRFFETEPGRLILGATILRRELKFSILADSAEIPGFTPGERVLLQGVVDCCVEDGEGLTVIDFKTDRVDRNTVRERAELYRGQVETYAFAMERVLGKPVKRRILCFLTAGLSAEL